MSKKDLLERISRTNSGPVVRRAAEGTTRVQTPTPSGGVTRVSRRVVRRRKKNDEESDAVVTVRRRRAAEGHGQPHGRASPSSVHAWHLPRTPRQPCQTGTLAADATGRAGARSLMCSVKYRRRRSSACKRSCSPEEVRGRLVREAGDEEANCGDVGALASR